MVNIINPEPMTEVCPVIDVDALVESNKSTNSSIGVGPCGRIRRSNPLLNMSNILPVEKASFGGRIEPATRLELVETDGDERFQCGR